MLSHGDQTFDNEDAARAYSGAALDAILRDVLRRALIAANVLTTDAQQNFVIEAVMANAEWQDKARAVWGNPAAAPWQPMETAPFEKRVLIVDARFRCVTEGFQYRKDGWKTYGVSGCYDAKPLAWQPMPEPPAGFDADPNA